MRRAFPPAESTDVHRIDFAMASPNLKGGHSVCREVRGWRCSNPVQSVTKGDLDSDRRYHNETAILTLELANV
jgi:hypothetical protein